MTSDPVLVTGALGNVGSATASALLRQGVPVRVADIDVKRLRDRFPDAEATRLDFLEPASFPPAVEGCSSLFLLRPPPISRVGPTLNALVDVASSRGVGHVVFSSVEGADTNRVVPHHRVEVHLQGSGLSWTILRPGFFAQNLTVAYAADIRDDDRLYLPAGDARVAFIDAHDIGEVAAAVLVDPAPHVGRGYTLTGPQAVTFDQVAAMLTDALGRTIRYQPATALGYVRHLRRHGLPAAQIAVQTILHLGLRRGDAENVSDNVEKILGRPAAALDAVISRELDLWRRAG